MFDETKEDVSKIYDFHLLAGHFTELDDAPMELVTKNISEAESIYSESKNKKGTDKILKQITAIIKYSSALTLLDKCIITDIEGMFSFICIRHPELELDWRTLQRIILHSSNSNIDYQDQKTLELAINIYISAIKKILPM